MVTVDERRTILMVEADEPLAQVATAYLERDGYEVTHVRDLASALDVTRARRAGASPRLLMVDLDSLDARERGSLECEDLAYLPVMLLASDPFPPRWLQRPGVTVLSKPFAMQELRRRIHGAASYSRDQR